MQPVKIAVGDGSFTAHTLVEGFHPVRTEDYALVPDGMIRRQQLSEAEGGRQITLIERFRPTSSGIRWETELWSDSGKPFSVPVHAEIRCESGLWSKYWTPWADPRPEYGESPGDTALAANGDLEGLKNSRFSWVDPLCSRAAENRRFWYGAPYFEVDNPRLGFTPFQHDLVCMPMVTAFHESAGVGVTFALSPEDPLLDIVLDTTEDGVYRFSRLFYRLEAGRPLQFAADLIAHENDWRGGVRWMTERYPKFFHPALPVADDIAGTGAYSTHEVEFDYDKLRRMAFKVNWKASFDFPYMGMFLPDVPDDEEWRAYGNYPTSIRQMREYSAVMRSRGFHVLSYFNVTEFGADVQFPLPEAQSAETVEPDSVWKDCSLFLSRELKEAMLMDPQGKPYRSWGYAVAMDPGEPGYRRFLLEQARRHIERIPDSCGLCVDRLDWTRLYNDRGDDGISWFGGKACRSLQFSWREMSELLGELLHSHGKVLYCNNHTKRLEQLLHVDGIFDEFTYAATALNTSAFLGFCKPVLGWIAHAGQVMPDYHAFFQKYLYMGVFPMAPFPGNDHSLQPDPQTDNAFLEYGPLLERLRGKKWVLSPFPVHVEGQMAIANVFEVPGGFVVPVVYGKSDRIRVSLRLPVLAMQDVQVKCEALYPGSDQPYPLDGVRQDSGLVMDVPLRNGCALVTVTLREGICPPNRQRNSGNGKNFRSNQN